MAGLVRFVLVEEEYLVSFGDGFCAAGGQGTDDEGVKRVFVRVRSGIVRITRVFSRLGIWGCLGLM